ncbi:HAD-IA family hydrolase [Cyanobium sp. CH-040]|uniref:HAD-IA family hydrolase n=1 Tax=Cyanobium sp. CH-040 TaxID=2823708 RepID=UPI0020CF92AB|nr:HAD-IA family hydrolase [Cyanobium sp. CH-040]MCP9927241.1 HAD-IA family hydrolase [Cyanobium sp. CH-040]
MTAGQRPRGLLLDAMGTLIGLREPVGLTYARLAGRHGIGVAAEAVERAFRASYRQAPPLAFPDLGGAALERAEVAWWGERISESVVGAGGPPAPEALVQELFAHFADPVRWQVYADVPAQLERWHARGLKLAVVSNFDSRLPGLLEHLGLARWLEVVVVSSVAGAAKPDPAPFRLALAGLGLSPQEAWHVGDSPEDVQGAAAAGLRCLLVRRP